MRVPTLLSAASVLALASAATAQERVPDLVLEGQFGELPPPEIVQFQEFDAPPPPPPGFYERFLAWKDQIGEDRRTLAPSNQPPPGPVPGTDTDPNETFAPNDFTLITNVALFPSNNTSNINEMSLDVGTRFIFATGNWWAARNDRGGKDGRWTYIDPYADFPTFCCDQYVAYDPGRDMFLWYRQGTGNPNRVRLGASIDNGQTWCFYEWDSNLFGLGNKFLDYPHMGLTNDHLYLTTNVFDGGFERMLLVKFELDDLAACQSANFVFWSTTSGWTWCPVEEGCTEEMYLGDHEDQDTFRIWAQNEGNSSLFLFRTDITPWTFTNRGDANCPDPNRVDPCARMDQRVITGAVHSGDGENPSDGLHSTTKRVTFMWNVAEGNGFPLPYTEAATFELGTWAYIRRPLVWSTGTAWIYASLGVNKRGHLGMSLFSAPPTDFVDHYVGLDDDYNGEPPGWEVHFVRPGAASPTSSAWGDYSQCRGLYPSELGWAASGWTMKRSGIVPHYTVFGRERDEDGIRKIYRKGGN